MTPSKKRPAMPKGLSSKVQKAFESMKTMQSPQPEVTDQGSSPIRRTLQKRRTVSPEETLEALLTPQTLRRIQTVLEQKQLQLGITDHSSLVETAITEWLERNGY